MKKIVIVLIVGLISVSAHSQNAKYVNAINYLADYNSVGDASALDKAKENIDICDANPEFKEKAKTQTLKGQIYLAIFQKNLRTETEKQIALTDPKKGEGLGYQNTSAVELMTAYDAFAKAKTLDSKNNFTADIKKGISDITILLSNKAVYDYSGKNYVGALPSFEKTLEINGAKDTITLNNCAVTAEHAGNMEKAKMYYQKMIDIKLGHASSYSSLLNIYLKSNSKSDTLIAKKMLVQARAAYPNDLQLLITETNFYLADNKSADAMKNLNIAILAKPTQPDLYMVRGNLYDNLANPKDGAGKFTEQPKDFEDKIKLAESDYKKAVELKSDYYEAIYALGVLYINYGVSINRAADKITNQKLYDAETTKSKDEFNKALPVMEHALQVKPKDRNSMIALKQVYSRLEMNDKLKEINKELDK